MKPISIYGLALLVLLSLVLIGCGGSSNAEKHVAGGVELQEQGRVEAAIAEYDEAISLDSEYA